MVTLKALAPAIMARPIKAIAITTVLTYFTSFPSPETEVLGINLEPNSFELGREKGYFNELSARLPNLADYRCQIIGNIENLT